MARIHFALDRTAGSSSSRNPLLGYGAQDPLEYCDDGHCWSGGRGAKVELRDLGCRRQLGREVCSGRTSESPVSSTRTRISQLTSLDNTKPLRMPPTRIPSSIRNAQNNTWCACVCSSISQSVVRVAWGGQVGIMHWSELPGLSFTVLVMHSIFMYDT